ncbi:MAG: isoaspartyl peptidase/L-asparaginase family protein [Myxococcota bacterium]
MKPAILVHGGAGPIRQDDRAQACAEGCLEAARLGYGVLISGSSALDAVEAAAVALEDDPNFNAGVGSALTIDGEVEMDAMVMVGEKLQCGGVAALRGFRNPIRIARRVLEQSPHVLLAGLGAERFAREQGFEPCPPAELVTERALRRWRKERDAGWPRRPGTIGAVAIDQAGSLAVATSTGGISGKYPGRVGDTPLVGCGTYADTTGAASATGYGEQIARVVMAKHACDRIGSGMDAQAAAESAVAALGAIGGEGGIIVVDGAGRLGVAFNSNRMGRAHIDAEGRESAAFE